MAGLYFSVDIDYVVSHYGQDLDNLALIFVAERLFF